MNPSMDEAELIERSRVNDRAAQQELYLRTSDRVFGLLLRMTRNEADATDLAQETYLKAFTCLAQFDGRSTFATWLYRLAVNEALQFRKQTHRFGDRSANSDLHTLETNPSQSRDVTIDLEDALVTVNEHDRAVLLLRYQEGLDYRAIADALECSMGTVASRLNRARDKVRQLLKKSYAPAEETPPADHLNNGGLEVAGEQPLGGGKMGPRVEKPDI